MKRARQPLLDLCTSRDSFLRQFYASLAAGVLLLLPIILFVHRYIDDYDRSMDGDFKLSGAGRPLAELLFHVVNFGAPAVAVAPLYQLLSIVVLSIACVVSARAYGIRHPFWSAVCTAPLMGQPYFLENMSYGFDCLGMALSVVLAVIAAVWVLVSASLWGFLGTSLLLAGSLALYQPGTSAFLGFAPMLAVSGAIGLSDDLLGHQSATARVMRIAFSYLLALVVYKLILLVSAYSPTSYASSQGQLLALDLNLPGNLLANAWLYWKTIYDDWNGWPIAAIFLLLGGAYSLSIWLCSGPFPGLSPQPFKRIGYLLGLLAAVALIGLLSPGALLLLKDPLASVPRMIVFVGPLLAAICLHIVAAVSRCDPHKRSGQVMRLGLRAAVITFIWLLAVFSYAYGHAFSAQAEYESGRISRILNGYARLQARQVATRITAITIDGEMPKSPLLANTRKKFPLVNRLVPRLLNHDWAWGRKQLQFYGADFHKINENDERLTTDAESFCDDPNTSECTSEYSMRAQGNTLVLRIHSSP